jgi:hypothetical protein
VPGDGRVDFQEGGRIRRAGHASRNQSADHRSTLRCISRSNLSAVYSPDAMCVMMYLAPPSFEHLQHRRGNVLAEHDGIFSRCSSLTMSRSPPHGVRPCAGWTTPRLQANS